MREPIHPGKFLRDNLDAMNMSASEFARRLDVPANRITQILNGQRSITADTALRLAHFFSTSAEYWMNLQATYELDVVKQNMSVAIVNLPAQSQNETLKQVAKATPSK